MAYQSPPDYSSRSNLLANEHPAPLIQQTSTMRTPVTQQHPITQQPNIIRQQQHVGPNRQNSNNYQDKMDEQLVYRSRLIPTILPQKLERFPLQMNCGNCGADIVTTTRTSYSICQWATCGTLSCLALFIFAWIPFFIPECADTVHTCPQCKAYVGFHRVCAPGY